MATKKRSRKIPITAGMEREANVSLPYLTDEQAEQAGAEIAQDFGLKRSREHKGAWETESSWFYNKGIARRAFFMLTEAIRNNPEKKA